MSLAPFAILQKGWIIITQNATVGGGSPNSEAGFAVNYYVGTVQQVYSLCDKYKIGDQVLFKLSDKWFTLSGALPKYYIVNEADIIYTEIILS